MLMSTRPAAVIVFGVLVASLWASLTAAAQTPLSRGGANPQSALIEASDGSFYGTTTRGGLRDRGIVFRMMPDGQFTVLHEFSGGAGDGAHPYAALLQADDGNFYGTTQRGGASDAGTIFRIGPSGDMTLLYAFDKGSGNGYWPVADLIQASDGNLYGTAPYGGASGLGTVFRITLGGEFTRVHDFTRYGGPSGLMQASDGKLYGTTRDGFFNAYSRRYMGTIFSITLDGAFTQVHQFSGFDGIVAGPTGTLVEGDDAHLYGTTNYAFDTIPAMTVGGHAFRLNLTGKVTVIHQFHADREGLAPTGLIKGADGHFYGTMQSHGGAGRGSVFRMTPEGAVTRLHAFPGEHGGENPGAKLTPGSDGTLFGTTIEGGLYNSGIVFQITMSGTTSIRHAFRPGLRPRSGIDSEGDGRADIAVFRPSTGTWYVRQSARESWTHTQWGLPGDIPVSGDFDGDGLGDRSVYRPSNGTWWLLTGTGGRSYQWGLPGDIPFSGDWDGGGTVDLSVYRPSDGTWHILYGPDFRFDSARQWGLPGDIPVPGDFDGNGTTDAVVWRPATGVWHLPDLQTGPFTSVPRAFQWGLAGDVPLAGDYDGDGRCDLAVWRPSNGVWYILRSSTGYSLAHSDSYQWGLPGDEPKAGDYDGDGQTDLVIYRPSTGEWFLRYSSTGYDIDRSAYYQWGLSDDLTIR